MVTDALIAVPFLSSPARISGMAGKRPCFLMLLSFGLLLDSAAQAGIPLVQGLIHPFPSHQRKRQMVGP